MANIWVLLFLVLPQFAFAGDLNNFILKDGSRFQAEVLSYEGGVYRLRSDTYGEFNLLENKVLFTGKEPRATAATPLNDVAPKLPINQTKSDTKPVPQVVKVNETAIDTVVMLSSDVEPKPAQPTKQEKSDIRSEPKKETPIVTAQTPTIDIEPKPTKQAVVETRPERQVIKPGETYFGLGGGGSFPFRVTDFQETWPGGNMSSSGLDHKNSWAWGARIGHFLPNQYSWLGFELDFYDRHPDIRRQPARVSVAPPASSGQGQLALDVNYLRTLGFAAIFRPYTFNDRIQPYLKTGLALNFLNVGEGKLYDASGSFLGSFLKDESDMGLGPLGSIGINYVVSPRFSAFVETTYTRSTFNLRNFDRTVTDRFTYSDITALAGLNYSFYQ